MLTVGRHFFDCAPPDLVGVVKLEQFQVLFVLVVDQ